MIPKNREIFDAGQGAGARRPFGIRLRREMRRYAKVESDTVLCEKIWFDE